MDAFTHADTCVHFPGHVPMKKHLYEAVILGRMRNTFLEQLFEKIMVERTDCSFFEGNKKKLQEVISTESFIIFRVIFCLY